MAVNDNITSREKDRALRSKDFHAQSYGVSGDALLSRDTGTGKALVYARGVLVAGVSGRPCTCLGLGNGYFGCGWRGTAKRACLRNAGPRIPTSIFQRHQRSSDYTIKRFPALQIAQCQFFDLNNSMNQEASTNRCKVEDFFTDIGFFGHLIPLAKPLPADRLGS